MKLTIEQPTERSVLEDLHRQLEALLRDDKSALLEIGPCKIGIRDGMLTITCEF